MICGEIWIAVGDKRLNNNPMNTSPTVYGNRNRRATIETMDAIKSKITTTSSIKIIFSPVIKSFPGFNYSEILSRCEIFIP
jgi:hypothetical protein